VKIPSPLAGPRDRPVFPGDDDIDILAGVNLKMFEAVPSTVGPFGTSVLYWDVEGPWGFHVELNQEVVPKGGLKVVQPTAPIVYRLTAHTQDESRVLGEVRVDVSFDGCESVFQRGLAFLFKIQLTQYVHDSPELKFRVKVTKTDPFSENYQTEEIPPVISFADHKISVSLRLTTTLEEAVRWNRKAHSVLIRENWTNLQFVFSGGNRVIFVVHNDGRFEFYRHESAQGSEYLTGPYPITTVAWRDYKFVFSGGNGIIYAVDKEGNLYFYRVNLQGNTGTITTPRTIGRGLMGFKFVFSIGNGNIFAVTNEGNLLHYRDSAQNGTGDVAYPAIVRRGGWNHCTFAFSAGQGDIYATLGENLYLHNDVLESNELEYPMSSAVWTNFSFVFSGMDRSIYGLDRDGKFHYFPESTIHILDRGLLTDVIAWGFPNPDVNVDFSFRLVVRDGGIYTTDEQIRIGTKITGWARFVPAIVLLAGGELQTQVQRARGELHSAIQDIATSLNSRFLPPAGHRRRWVRILEEDQGTIECLMCPLPEEGPAVVIG
jgi:hypothetical protein